MPAVGVIALLFWIVGRLPDFFVKAILPPADHARFPTLDGLRALLAIGVVFSHVFTLRETYFAGRPWGYPANPYFYHWGQQAVAMFFMVTGCLFWDKALSAEGRIRVRPFYRARARRLLPLYYFLCIVVIAVAVARQPARFLSTQLPSELLSFVIPGWQPAGDIAGFQRLYLFGQTWTLWYESLFYLALPAFAIAARSRVTTLVFLGVCLVATAGYRIVTDRYHAAVWFLAGIVTAQLLHDHPRIVATLRTRAISSAIIAIVVVSPWWVERWPGAVLAGSALAFAGIAAGNSLFGVLNLRGARLLGASSYSLYLLHLLVLFPLFSAVNRHRPIVGLGSVEFWALAAASVVTAAMLSLVTYRWIEKPWLPRRTISPCPPPSPLPAPSRSPPPTSASGNA